MKRSKKRLIPVVVVERAREEAYGFGDSGGGAGLTGGGCVCVISRVGRRDSLTGYTEYVISRLNDDGRYD